MPGLKKAMFKIIFLRVSVLGKKEPVIFNSNTVLFLVLGTHVQPITSIKTVVIFLFWCSLTLIRRDDSNALNLYLPINISAPQILTSGMYKVL